jgi:hypothetical protein
VFCDRGTCAEGGDKPQCLGYGCECEPGVAPSAPDDPRVPAYKGGSCAGYICIDFYCRSCVSDEECQKGTSDYKCLAYEGLPGKRCGNPSHALRDPKLPQPKL